MPSSSSLVPLLPISAVAAPPILFPSIVTSVSPKNEPKLGNVWPSRPGKEGVDHSQLLLEMVLNVIFSRTILDILLSVW